MALIFCNDDGSNTSPYETWAKAATTLLVAIDAAAAGDTIYIGADHAEVPVATVTYNSPGTAANPCNIISSTVGAASVVVYNKADNVQIDNSATGGADIAFQGVAKYWGLSFKSGDDIRSAASTNFTTLFECELEMTSSAAIVQMGNNGANSLELINTNITWSTGHSTSKFLPGKVIWVWRGGTLSWTNPQPVALIDQLSASQDIYIEGVDFSSITSSLIDADNLLGTIVFQNCLLNSSVSVLSNSINLYGSSVLFVGSDDTTANDLYRLEYYDYWGSTVHDDAIFRGSGASDGTNNISWKMVSTANAQEFSYYTKSPPIVGWVDATGSTTFTVNCLWDSVANIQDDEVWVEIEYLGTAANPIASFINDRMADITATPADQTTNAETWTEPLTNDNEFQVNVTVTVNRVGPVIARVCLAKPSTTIYVDPLIVVS